MGGGTAGVMQERNNPRPRPELAGTAFVISNTMSLGDSFRLKSRLHLRSTSNSVAAAEMDDIDMMAAMGISGFGKAAKKTKLDPSRFDKNKRGEVSLDLAYPSSVSLTNIQVPTPPPISNPDTKSQAVVKGPVRPDPESEPESDLDEPGPSLPPPAIKSANPAGQDVEPEYDPSEPEYDADDDDLPTFPTTHEIVLKDHTKVVSALTLDPSGARVLSGSHDYDIKLWDFGGMDARCKPFKSWEPAGTYYVCLISGLGGSLY